MFLIFRCHCFSSFFFFFFNDTATTEIYTLSLHDALPISRGVGVRGGRLLTQSVPARPAGEGVGQVSSGGRSEEHTSELQSQSNLVCRLLLEKKKKKTTHVLTTNYQLTYVSTRQRG